jgi:hypothetical protein
VAALEDSLADGLLSGIRWDEHGKGFAGFNRGWGASKDLRAGMPALHWLDEFAFLEFDGFLEFGGEVQGVGHDDEGEVLFAVQVDEELGEVGGGGAVESAGGFVREEEFGLVDQGADDGDALAFAAGELGGAVFEPRAEADAVEEFAGAVRGAGAEDAIFGGECGDEDVFEDGALGQKMVTLEDEADLAVAKVSEGEVVESGEVLAIKADGAGGGAVEGADDVEEGAFAGTGWADDGEGIAGREGEVDAVQDGECGTIRAGVVFCDVLEGEEAHAENVQCPRTNDQGISNDSTSCTV